MTTLTQIDTAPTTTTPDSAVEFAENLVAQNPQIAARIAAALNDLLLEAA